MVPFQYCPFPFSGNCSGRIIENVFAFASCHRRTNTFPAVNDVRLLFVGILQPAFFQISHSRINTDIGFCIGQYTVYIFYCPHQRCSTNKNRQLRIATCFICFTICLCIYRAGHCHRKCHIYDSPPKMAIQHAYHRLRSQSNQANERTRRTQTIARLSYRRIHSSQPRNACPRSRRKDIPDKTIILAV